MSSHRGSKYKKYVWEGMKREDAAEILYSVAITVPTLRCCRALACKPCLFSGVGGGEAGCIEKVGFSVTSRAIIRWLASQPYRYVAVCFTQD